MVLLGLGLAREKREMALKRDGPWTGHPLLVLLLLISLLSVRESFTDDSNDFSGT